MPRPTCHAHVLGPLRLLVDGEEVALGGPRPRLLLALLLVAGGRPVSIERLIDDLYGEDPPATARKSVQVHVSNLRRSLDRAEAIITTADGYRLHEDVEIDATVFASAVEEAVALAPSDPRRASTALTGALQLWRGTPFADLANESAIRPEVARLEELRLRALEVRIDALLRLGGHAEVLGELETLTREHPYREAFRAQQMVALYRASRQAEALRVYDRARELLVEELGIEPSARLREVHAAVLNQDPALGAPLAEAGQPAGGEPRRTLRGYELRELLGSGPRGEVRRAYHASTGREHALKIISPEISNRPDFVRRFEAEAQFVAGISHPSIVPVEDHWRDPDGAYVVSPLLVHGSLADLLADGPLESPAALRVLDHVGAALAHLHRHGIVHGAVTPTNVLLDEDGDPHLTDVVLGGAAGDVPAEARRYAAPERLAGAPADQRSDLHDLALLFHELLTGSRPPHGVRLPPLDRDRTGTPAALDEVLARGAAPSPADRHDRVEDFLRAVRQVMGADVVRQPAPAAGDHRRNPYKGLRSFSEADAPDFHGRASVVEQLLEALQSSNVVTLVGPSGSGKSSVVRAGLVPTVRAGALDRTTTWVVAEMFPGAYPFEELEAALLGVAADRPTGLAEQLASDDHGLLRASKQLLPGDDTSLLLVVDQFEELFALVPRAATRDRFLANLVAVATDARSRVRVVLTLRADFFDRPLQHPAFGAVLERSAITISMPSEEALAMAISRPAHAVGLELEPGLVPAIIADVIGEPGGLPLLQYCLTELVEHGRHDELSLAAYEDIGRAPGALARRAEEIHASLPPAGRAAARHLLLRLVAVSTDSDDTRRRVPLAQLRSMAPDAAAMDLAIEEFGTHRLLTFDHDPVTRSPTVEVAHEALLHRWPRYEAWIEERRADMLVERRLEGAAAEWDDEGRAPDALLRGERLEQFEAWATTTDLPLTAVMRAYLAESRAAADAAADTEAEHARREVALQRRSRWLLASAVVAAVLVVVATVAWNSRSSLSRDAELVEQARRSQEAAAQLGAAAAEVADDDPALAASLALAGAHATAGSGEVDPAVVDALHWALQDGGTTFPTDADTPIAVRPSPEGLRGVFLLPLDDLVRIAGDELARPLTEDECAAHAEEWACADPTAPLPAGLAIAGGETAYRALTEPDAPLTGTSVNLATWLPDSDLVGQPVADALLLESLSRATAGAGITITHDQVDTLSEDVFDQGVVEVDVLMALERSVLTWAAGEGEIHDLSGFLDADEIERRYGRAFTDFVTIEGGGDTPAGLYGVPTSLIGQSLITYNRDAFAAAGYEVPTTLDELVALSDQIVADGATPWCWAGKWLEEPGGFPLGAWPAGMLVSESGPDAVGRWGRGELPSASPEVRRAYERLGQLVFTPGYSATPPEQVPDTDFFLPVFEVAAAEPTCLMLLGSSIPITVLTSEEQLDRVDVFPLPPADAGTEPSLLVQSTIAMLAVDSPENRRVVEAMTSPTFLRSYVDVSEGFVPPDPSIDTTVDDPLYLQTQPRRVHALLIELLQTATREDRIVFGPNELFPVEAIRPLLTAPVDWFRSGGEDLDAVLQEIDAAVSGAAR